MKKILFAIVAFLSGDVALASEWVMLSNDRYSTTYVIANENMPRIGRTGRIRFWRANVFYKDQSFKGKYDTFLIYEEADCSQGKIFWLETAHYLDGEKVKSEVLNEPKQAKMSRREGEAYRYACFWENYRKKLKFHDVKEMKDITRLAARAGKSVTEFEEEKRRRPNPF